MSNEEVKNNLLESFKKLDLDSKRDEYNKEFISLAWIIKTFLREFDEETEELPKNYIKGQDRALSESDLLNINYINLIDLKNDIVLLLQLMQNRNK